MRLAPQRRPSRRHPAQSLRVALRLAALALPLAFSHAAAQSSAALDPLRERFETLAFEKSLQHPEAAQAGIAYAQALIDAKQFALALQVSRATYEGMVEAVGDKHEAAAITAAPYIVSMREMGRLDAALELAAQSYRTLQKTIGWRDRGGRSTATVKAGVQFAIMLAAVGKKDRAEDTLDEVERKAGADQLSEEDREAIARARDFARRG